MAERRCFGKELNYLRLLILVCTPALHPREAYVKTFYAKSINMKEITILIADDHSLVREAWRIVLNSQEQFNVIAEAATAAEAIELSKKYRPGLVIMDINLPDLSGIVATPVIRKYAPLTKILAVSSHTQPAYVKSIMHKGASGYITKNSPKKEMFEAITEVYNGNLYLCSEIKNILSTRLIDTEHSDQGINALTQREIEVIGFVKEGYSSKEIAFFLCISTKTVEVHRHNILRKLNLKNSSSLVNLVHTRQLQF
jgi:two-component system invasion response regulator UvrY